MAEKKEPIKVSLPVFIAVIIILVAIVFGVFMFMQNKKLEGEITRLREEISNAQTTKNELQNKLNTIAETVNSNNPTATEKKQEDVEYTVTTKDENIAVIKATKNGNTTTKEFEMNSIADNETLDIPNVGKVAVVADSGGEYYGAHIYQLVDNEIKELGEIDLGADVVKNVDYTVDTKGETTAIIKAATGNQNVTEEIEMSAMIDKTNVVEILGTKVVLVAETGGEYYGVQVYRLSQDYTNGKIEGIKNVGLIKPNISL